MPLTLEKHERKLKDPGVCQQLPVRDYLDNIIVRTNGSFVAGYELRGLNTYFASDDGRNRGKLMLEALLRSIPEQSMRLQLRYEVVENLGDLLDRYVATQQSTNEAVLALDETRIERWKEREAEGLYARSVLHAYFIWDPAIHNRLTGKHVTAKRPMFSLSTKACISRTQREHQELLAEFESLLNGIESTLPHILAQLQQGQYVLVPSDVMQLLWAVGFHRLGMFFLRQCYERYTIRHCVDNKSQCGPLANRQRKQSRAGRINGNLELIAQYDLCNILVRLTVSNALGYGYHKDMLIYFAVESISQCDTAGSTKSRGWLSRIAPTTKQAGTFTDGDETSNVVLQVATACETACPDVLHSMYVGLCAEEEFHWAEEVFPKLVRVAARRAEKFGRVHCAAPPLD